MNAAKRLGLTEEIRGKFRERSKLVQLSEKDIEIIWNNFYDPINIYDSRAGGFQSATGGAIGGIFYNPYTPDSIGETRREKYEDIKCNPFAKRREFADAESRLRKILNEDTDLTNYSESAKMELKKYQEADPSTFEYQVYHFTPFRDSSAPYTWRDKSGKTNYKELIDKCVGSIPENNTTPPPQPNSYSTTYIKVDKEFAIKGVKNDPNQITLKLAGPGYIIEGIGGVNYNYVVINHRGQIGKFSPGKKIKVSGIEMGPDKTFISYHNDQITLNILDYYQQVELVNGDDNSSSENKPSAFEIVFEAIMNDVELKQILQQAKVEGDFFLDMIANKESNFIKGNAINYQAVRVLLGTSTPTQSKPIQEVRNEIINEITTKLNQSPILSNSDLPSDYQNWQKQIKSLNEETKIKSFRDAILVVIKSRRVEQKKTQKHNQELDEANSSNATDEQRVNTLKNSGDLIGKETPEQKAKMEQIEKELEKNPAKLREAIQGQLIKQMEDQKVEKEELVDSKAEWENLKTELNPAKIKSIKQKVSQEVGNKGVDKKLVEFTRQVEVFLKSRDGQQIQQLKDQLIEFISSPSTYYQARVSDAQALLTRLENPNYQDSNSPPSNLDWLLWKIVVPISLLTVLVVGIAIAMVWRKKRK